MFWSAVCSFSIPFGYMFLSLGIVKCHIYSETCWWSCTNNLVSQLDYKCFKKLKKQKTGPGGLAEMPSVNKGGGLGFNLCCLESPKWRKYPCRHDTTQMLVWDPSQILYKTGYSFFSKLKITLLVYEFLKYFMFKRHIGFKISDPFKLYHIQDFRK